ncbi:MAG: orotate phosphoribosyltransferase [Deferrisomatales bacterium]|nr:orotate phosphoribosyltransferase [Deferrisomatales bacterium]
MDGTIERMRGELLGLLREKSYQERPVTLASGRRSTFYVDGKQTALHPRGAYLIGRLFWERLGVFGPVDAVGGPTLGADPLATATSLVSGLLGEGVPAFIVRKEPKGHGTKSWIEGKGNLIPGGRAVVLEDVVTTGGSSLVAVEKVESEGYRVLGVLALVDRQEGGREALEAKGYRFEALFTKAEVRGRTGGEDLQ